MKAETQSHKYQKISVFEVNDSEKDVKICLSNELATKENAEVPAKVKLK